SRKVIRASAWTNATAELRMKAEVENAEGVKSPQASSVASEIGSCRGGVRSKGRVLAAIADSAAKGSQGARKYPKFRCHPRGLAQKSRTKSPMCRIKKIATTAKAIKDSTAAKIDNQSSFLERKMTPTDQNGREKPWKKSAQFDSSRNWGTGSRSSIGGDAGKSRHLGQRSL